MTTRSIGVLVVLSSLLPFAGATKARADHLVRLDQLTERLQCSARDLNEEVRGEFRGTPEFGRLNSAASRMCALATQLQHLVGRAACPTELKKNLCQFDRLVDDFDNLLDDVDDGCRCHRYRIDTRPAHRTLRCVEDLVDDLRDVVDDLPQFSARPVSQFDRPAPQFARPVPQYDRPAPRGALGIHVGAGRFSFSFNGREF